MPKCIYCTSDLVPGAADGSQPSMEHIVQYAIGGSDSLVTSDACVCCNSTLGRTVDADFINQELIGILRLMHDAVGRSGNVPNVVLNTRSMDTSEPGSLILKKGAIDVKHDPVVIRDKFAQDSEEILIAGMPDQARKIAEGILNKAKKGGRQIKTASGKTVETVDDLFAESVSEASSNYHAQFKIDLIALMRGYAKIAFSFAHRAFGPSWTFSQSAQPLREVATGISTTEAVKAITLGATKELRRVFVGAEAEGSKTHVVGILPIVDGKILVSLFGGSFSYCFKIGDIPWDMLEDAMVRGHIAVELDPTTRTVRTIGLSELCSCAMSLGQPSSGGVSQDS